MANSARAVLETALRAKHLDRTLTTSLPVARSDDKVISTGVTDVDRVLQGGMPRGHLSEIAGPPSSGRTTMALRLMAEATARGELAAYVDTFDRLDVSSASAAGIVFERLLWVRGQAISRTDAHTDLRDRTLERALKAFMLVLQAGGFGLVVLDLADVPPLSLQRLPPATWLRVQRAVEGHDTACVLVVPAPLARSSGGLTLTLVGRPLWSGDSERSRVMSGIRFDGRVRSPRRRVGAEAVTMSARHAWVHDVPAASAGQ